MSRGHPAGAVRLFVGAPVPSAHAFTTATEDLCRLPDVRPVPDGTWHVTLRFLGDADPDGVVAALDPVLARPPPVRARVQGVGAFSDPRKARVAWAGVAAEGLAEVETRVREATIALGRPPERRAFVPHVTLARLGRPVDVRPWIGRHQDTVFFDGPLPEIVLFRSELTRQGPVHHRQAAWPLPQP